MCTRFNYPCRKVLLFITQKYIMTTLNHWSVDIGRYYSSKSNRYLVYSNSHFKASDKTSVVRKEFLSLAAAFSIGEILNRIVVLPRFSCGCIHDGMCPDGIARKPNRLCHLYSLYKVPIFENKFFSKYRENGFLSHPKVPLKIKNSFSHVISTTTR